MARHAGSGVYLHSMIQLTKKRQGTLRKAGRKCWYGKNLEDDGGHGGQRRVDGSRRSQLMHMGFVYLHTFLYHHTGVERNLAQITPPMCGARTHFFRACMYPSAQSFPPR